MDAVTLADSFGVCTPQGIAMVVKQLKARFKQPIEIHCHEDFGLGVANTIAALSNGASVAHVTVSATGERAGNVPLEDTVMALRVLYGIETGVKTEKFYELSKLVQRLAGFTVPPNRPIVGDSLYNIESGIVAMFHRRKGNGLANIEEHLERRGRQATPEQTNEILARVKQTSIEKKALLTGAEFDEILKSVIGVASPA
jgi:isopropylmalate/homocitrate/citramalate synthase